AKKLAAAMAYIALANLDRVTIEAAGGTNLDRLPPTRGKAQVWRLLEFLDELEAQGSTDLHDGLRQFSLRNSTPGMKVVISDFLLKRYEANLKALVGGLRDYARTRGLAYFFVQSSSPVEQVILNSMRRTGVVK